MTNPASQYLEIIYYVYVDHDLGIVLIFKRVSYLTDSNHACNHAYIDPATRLVLTISHVFT